MSPAVWVGVMANPEEIGPAYQCTTCLAWGPAEVCATCEAEASIVVGVDFAMGDDHTVITVNGLDVDELNSDAFAGVHNVEGSDFGPITFDTIREAVARLTAARLLDEFMRGATSKPIVVSTPASRDAVMRRVVRDVEDRLRRAPWREGGPPMAPPGKPDRDE